MAWIEPKTDWVDTDFFNYSDYNRIVGNISEIKSLLHDMFPDFGFGVMNYPKDYTSMFYASEMNTIENNLHALNSNSYELNIGNKHFYKINGATPDYEEWNRIENTLLTLHERIVAQQEEDTSPTIQILSNTNAWTSNSSYTIYGKLTANGNGIGGAKLMEKNQTLTVREDGSFYYTVTLNSGANNFTIKAWDSDNNPKFLSFTKRYDGTLPIVTITSPVNTWNTSSTYTITGRAVDNESGISSVAINGSPVTVASDGSFSKTITLTNTDNIFTVTVYNNAGQMVTNDYHAYFDNNPPSIALTSSTATTTVRSYPLSGRAIDNESGIASVTVNGSPVYVDGNGYFSGNYTLSEGVNTFTAVATDRRGNSRSTSLSVIWVNPSADYGTNIQYSGHSHQDWASGLSCRYSDDVDNDLNYSVHGSAQANVTADFRHKYGANYMSLSVTVEAGGDTSGGYDWWLMDAARNVLNSYSIGNRGSGTYGITVNTSAYANRTDVFLRVRVRSEVGDWVSAYSSGGWGATASMSGCTQSV